MRHLSYANVMATVAVFVALGGGAYAAVHVNGKDIQNRTIAGKNAATVETVLADCEAVAPAARAGCT